MTSRANKKRARTMPGKATTQPRMIVRRVAFAVEVPDPRGGGRWLASATDGEVDISLEFGTPPAVALRAGQGVIMVPMTNVAWVEMTEALVGESTGVRTVG